MFGIDINIIAFMVLAGLGAAGVMYAIMYDNVANERSQEKRVNSIRQNKSIVSAKKSTRITDGAKRRKEIQDTLKQLEEGQVKRKKDTLKKRISQAGMSVSLPKFYMFSLIFGMICTIFALISGAALSVVGCVFVVCSLGLPRWFVNFRRKRRFNAFLTEFPNSVDIIVRGVRAGLPLNECLGIIAREAKEPIKSEFIAIVDAQKMGIPLNEAIGKLFENVPLAESNFFGIVISIQSTAGGNLSEALGNLSNVLRDRKKMKAKVAAMSAEAKASGGIIGSLPFLVGGIVYLTSPEYIMILFTHPTGNLILVAAGIWMSMGIFVMKKMINFDF